MSEPIKPLDLDPHFYADLDEDVYAPAERSEAPVPTRARAVHTLTNSPGCEPDAEARNSESVRPIRRARRVRVDAWAAPAPANWGRTRRVVRKVGSGRHATLNGGSSERRPGVRATPSVDWALPF